MESKYIIYSNKYSFHERETKKHGKVYDVYFRVWDENGKPLQKKLAGSPTKTEAKKRYNKFIADNCKFELNKPKNQSTAPSEYIETAFDRWCKSMEVNNASATLYDRKRNFDNFIFPVFKGKKCDEITTLEINQWILDLSLMKKPDGEPYSFAYRNKVRETFRSFFSWWCQFNARENPFNKAIKTPGKKKKSQKLEFWTREQFEKFLKVVDDPMYHALFAFLFFTGQREGEILALSPDDIRKNRMVIDKSVTYKTNDGSLYKIVPTKEDRERIIPIGKPVVNELKKYKGEEPFFFGGSRPLPTTSVTRAFEKYTALAGLPKIKIHGLRHSFASLIIHNGGNLAVVADLLGDTLEQATRTYSHLYVSDRDEAIKLL